MAFHHIPSECPVSVLEPVGIVHAANAIEHFLNKKKRNDDGQDKPDMDFDYFERLSLSDRIASWIDVCKQATQEVP